VSSADEGNHDDIDALRHALITVRPAPEPTD
jgi:hypothetical protein